MIDLYARNFPYLLPEEQVRLAEFRVLLAGTGMASVIAETLLRTGFTNLHLVDGDCIESSNLNRQNFSHADLGRPKSEVLRDYLRGIHPQAHITAEHKYLSPDSIGSAVNAADIVVNTVDFEDGMFAICNRAAQSAGKPVFFPLNYGWASAVYYFAPSTRPLDALLDRYPAATPADVITLELAKYLVARDMLPDWFAGLFRRYQSVASDLEGLPQLHIGCTLAAAQVAAGMVDYIKGAEALPEFPVPIFADALDFRPKRRSLVGFVKAMALDWSILRPLRRRKH